jgi:hypothetical protein
MRGASLEMISSSGKVITTAVANGQSHTFDVRQLPSGLYIIKARSASKLRNLKFIKK